MQHGRKRGTKMNNKAYDLASYSFASGEQILVDTNIWLYLFPAPGNPQQSFARQYSTAFSRLVSAQAQPVLDPMVLSEYLNRYCRIEWAANFKEPLHESSMSRIAGKIMMIARSATKVVVILRCRGARHSERVILPQPFGHWFCRRTAALSSL